MGARQSRRSVDITPTPKKGEIETPVECEGKLEKISDLETKIATNGSIHNEIEYADKEETEKEDAEAAVKENGISDSEGSKTPDADVSIGDQLNESSDIAEKSPNSVEKSDETNENNKKNKEKSKKKKWSFRSISFSRKDKSKPGKDEKNGEVREVNEEGAEPTVATPTSPEENNGDQPTLPSGPTSDAEPIANDESGSPDNTERNVNEVPKLNDIDQTKSEEQPATMEPKPAIVKTEESVIIKEEGNVDEPKGEAQETKTEVVEQNMMTEVAAVENIIAESKEVRSEEVPPPLPSSNPPSPVTVFAESTMADAPPTDVPAAQSTSLVESAIVHPNNTPEALPPVSQTLDAENVSSKGDCFESIIDSSPATTSECFNQLTQEELSKLQTRTVSESPHESSSECVAELQAAFIPEPHVPPPSESVKGLLSEQCADLGEILTEELVNKFIEQSLLPSSETAVEPNLPTKDLEPESLPTPIEQVINTDSLPDISTESLPSLPEPLSESFPEPMSLPSVDCIPEPIALEPTSNSLTAADPIPNIPLESEKIPETVGDIPPSNSEVILTNGNTHDPPSPTVNGTALMTTSEGPIKQVIATSEIPDATEEKRHEINEADAPVPTAVEE